MYGLIDVQKRCTVFVTELMTFLKPDVLMPEALVDTALSSLLEAPMPHLHDKHAFQDYLGCASVYA